MYYGFYEITIFFILKKKEKKVEKRNVYVLGDSMIKKPNSYLLAKKIKHKHLVKLRSFSKISCMVGHVKPTLPEVKRSYHPP